MKLTLKLLLISELVLLLAVLALLIPVRNRMRQQVIEDLQNDIRAIAATAALQIDGNLHRQIRSPADASSPAFVRLRDQLRAIRDANHLANEHIYTFYRDGADRARFAVMTHVHPFIGDPYEMRPALRAAFDQGQIQVSDLYRDVNGMWISAYAPIRDSTGAVTGVLEVDRPAAAYFANYRSVTLLTVASGLTVLAISSLLGWLVLERIILRPMRAVREGMVALAGQNFRHRVKLKTGDEFQDLGETLNHVAQQLDMARVIQRNFFPKEIPNQPGWRIAAQSVSCDATGGDYFDAFALEDGRLVILVADVSGHGLGPSLLMSACRSALRALGTSGLEPQEWVDRLDRLLRDDLSDGRFITLILGVLDPDGTFTFANAGHGPAMVARRDGVISLESHRLPLGIGFDDVPVLPQTRMKLEPGDRIFFASDGVTEAMNPAGTMPDVDSIKSIIGDRTITCDEVLRRLDAFLITHCRGRAFSDDVTMLCVDRAVRSAVAEELVSAGGGIASSAPAAK